MRVPWQRSSVLKLNSVRRRAAYAELVPHPVIYLWYTCGLPRMDLSEITRFNLSRDIANCARSRGPRARHNGVIPDAAINRRGLPVTPGDTSTLPSGPESAPAAADSPTLRDSRATTVRMCSSCVGLSLDGGHPAAAPAVAEPQPRGAQRSAHADPVRGRPRYASDPLGPSPSLPRRCQPGRCGSRNPASCRRHLALPGVDRSVLPAAGGPPSRHTCKAFAADALRQSIANAAPVGGCWRGRPLW